MKQQLKLNESELYNIIEGAVKNLVLEYLPYFDGKAAARGLEHGDTSPFERFMQNGLNRGWTKDDMTDFQSGIEAGSSVGKGKEIYDEDFEDLNDSPVNTAVDGSLEDDIAFEEGKRAVKVNESQLFDIIKESVNILLKEYTGNVGYTNDNAPSNIGTPEYYRRNDRMQVGQEFINDNPNNWDKTTGAFSERSKNKRDSMPFNSR